MTAGASFPDPVPVLFRPVDLDTAMVGLGPFESRPAVAVAVSGGVDSLALAYLADAWARARGGRIIALTVDHGLRAESGREARTVGRWLASAGIDHCILRWRGSKPAAGIQAAAREARYGLLFDWCRRHSVLHLLLAHHRDDQAETVLMRLGRGSGVDGLAAMAALDCRGGVRILRPLLGVRKESLRRFLEDRGQDWIEDPSNIDPAYARTRVRNRLENAVRDATAGAVTAESLCATARRMGRARQALEDATTGALARWAECSPAGYVRLSREAFAETDAEIAARVVTRSLMCVGGTVYPPKSERLDRLLEWFFAASPGSGRTLAGCRIVARAECFLVCRESPRGGGAASPVLHLAAGRGDIWDGRFRVAFGHPPERKIGIDPASADCRVEVRALGPDGWRAVLARRPEARKIAIPHPARLMLPAFWRRRRLLAVPHLGYLAAGISPEAGLKAGHYRAVFFPRRSLAPEQRISS